MAVFLWLASHALSAQVRGSVRDAQTGEALARVSVKLAELDMRVDTGRTLRGYI